MQPLTPKNPIEAAVSPRSNLRVLRLCATLAWVGWGLSLGLLWAQHRLRVLHPWALIFLLLLAVTLLAALCGLTNALWRVGKGPQRRIAAVWGLACITPVGLWAALGLYLVSLARTSDSPKNGLTSVASMGIASLMQAQAQYGYPERLESKWLVMFYDDRVTQPSRDLEAMDQHVARLEALIGEPLRERIFWVRGEALGQRHMQFGGLVLGSSRSPMDWETADHPDRLSVDRHELAHAVIHQLAPSETDPPTLLIEGWAEAQAGMTTQKLAESAKQSRSFWRERTGAGLEQSYLRELTGPARYHHIDGAVYSVGGAFAEYLIRKYGIHRFLGLYFASRPGRFEAECLVQLGVEFDTLETEFWQEVDCLCLARSLELKPTVHNRCNAGYVEVWIIANSRRSWIWAPLRVASLSRSPAEYPSRRCWDAPCPFVGAETSQDLAAQSCPSCMPGYQERAFREAATTEPRLRHAMSHARLCVGQVRLPGPSSDSWSAPPRAVSGPPATILSHLSS